MLACPACGSENADGIAACARCHLAVELFGPLRDAVGIPETDPRYAVEVRELLEMTPKISVGRLERRALLEELAGPGGIRPGQPPERQR